MLPQSLLKLPILAAVIRHTTESEQLTSESEQLNSKGHKKLLSIFFFARLCLLFFTYRYADEFTSTVERRFELFTNLAQEA